MESNISPVQRPNSPPKVRKDEEGGPTSQPMGRMSYRYTSSTVDVEGYQWVVNSQMCGSGGARNPGTLEAAPSQQEAITRTSEPWASFQKSVGGMTERSARRTRREAESVKRYLMDKDDGNILLRTLVPNAGAPFQALFQTLERLDLASPASPASPTPPTKQEYMAATQASREGLQYRETEQSLEEILYLPSCG